MIKYFTCSTVSSYINYLLISSHCNIKWHPKLSSLPQRYHCFPTNIFLLVITSFIRIQLPRLNHMPSWSIECRKKASVSSSGVRNHIHLLLHCLVLLHPASIFCKNPSAKFWEYFATTLPSLREHTQYLPLISWVLKKVVPSLTRPRWYEVSHRHRKRGAGMLRLIVLRLLDTDLRWAYTHFYKIKSHVLGSFIYWESACYSCRHTEKSSQPHVHCSCTLDNFIIFICSLCSRQLLYQNVTRFCISQSASLTCWIWEQKTGTQRIRFFSILSWHSLRIVDNTNWINTVGSIMCSHPTATPPASLSWKDRHATIYP